MRISGDNHLLVLAFFPGLILVGFLLEVFVLGPVAAERSPAEEVAYWKQHVERNADFPSSRVRLGVAYQRVRQLDDALQAFDAALALDPDSEAAAIGRNSVLVEQGEQEKALSGLVEYTQRHPTCVACWHNLAAEYLHEGRLDEAELAARTLLASDLTVTSGMYGATDLHFEALVIAGRVYGARGEHDRAIELFREAVRREPDNVRGYILQAKVFVVTEQFDAALAALSTAQSLVEPEDVSTKEEIVGLQKRAARARARR